KTRLRSEFFNTNAISRQLNGSYCSYQPIWRKLKRNGGLKMGRSSEPFVIVALILLGFSLISRFISRSGLGISVTWRGTGYVLPPGSISVGLATALCFFATIYSLWMLPFNRTATLWHFWLTTIGIGVFWLAFYRAPNSREGYLGVTTTPMI